MVDENKLCVFTGYGDLDEAAVADHLSHIIQFPTIADRDLEAMDIGPFLGLRGYLEKTYPLVHQNCEREIIAGASMVAAAFFRVWQRIRSALSFILSTLVGPSDAAHIMSQRTPSDDMPVVRSYITFSTPPLTG